MTETVLIAAEIPPDKPIVLYCASGARSSAAARAMKQAGLADVLNAGGLADMPMWGRFTNRPPCARNRPTCAGGL